MFTATFNMVTPFSWGASQINLTSKIIKNSAGMGSNEHFEGGHINQSGAQGSQEGGVKLHGTKIVNMLHLGCNACQILT